MRLKIKTADLIESERKTDALRIDRDRGLAYLASTDWMITRQIETGKPVDQDTLKRRSVARKAVSDFQDSVEG